jgi:SAM-dependent methyltransferase
VPKLYTQLAAWWPLLSPPSHYVEEAADLLPSLLAATDPPPRTLLELGCGGGSLAFHLKRSLSLTLTDRSPAMLAVSRAVNPECEHIVGDMRTIDLGRRFDAVLVHDAIMYATDPESLGATLATARCSYPTASRRRSSRRPKPEARTRPMDAAYAISSGRGTRIPRTTPSSPRIHSSCAMRTAR